MAGSFDRSKRLEPSGSPITRKCGMHERFLTSLIGIGFACLLPMLGARADVAFHGTYKTEVAHIFIYGVISESDVAKFLEMEKPLRAKYDNILVRLDSPGGDVLAAMKIGEIIRADWLWTLVDDDAKCLSACVFLLAAGGNRGAGDRGPVAIHRPFFLPEYFSSLNQNQAKEKYDELTANVKSYLSKMVMSDDLFNAMMQVSSGEGRVLSSVEMKHMNLIGEDPGYAEWLRAKNVAKYGEKTWVQFEAWVKQNNAYIQRCIALKSNVDEETALVACDKEFRGQYPSPLPSDN